MTLKSRVTALENGAMGKGRLIVAIGPALFHPIAELRRRGSKHAPSDTLVVIRKPVDAAISISVNGRAS